MSQGRTPGLRVSPPRAPALNLKCSEHQNSLRAGGRLTTLKNPQRLIAYFPPPHPQPFPPPSLPSPLCAYAWHVGPFVVLIETETCLGPGVCCFNPTVEGVFFFFFFSFVCFSFPFSLPKPGGQCACRAEAVCPALQNKTLINGRWDFLVTAFSQRAKVAH